MIRIDALGEALSRWRGVGVFRCRTAEDEAAEQPANQAAEQKDPSGSIELIRRIGPELDSKRPQ